ncbi:hypothetical protein [Porphyrobacter sp. TH134]|uniref:hypothetical protein n=1 Tax=Porphyrobacter sp. TH134 TaxID=2067450 RepID=UPI0015517590|nr:hypothetical protein [Porphyrobacter sp. TH134]
MHQQEIANGRMRLRHLEMRLECCWHGRCPFKAGLVRLSADAERRAFFFLGIANRSHFRLQRKAARQVLAQTSKMGQQSFKIFMAIFKHDGLKIKKEVKIKNQNNLEQFEKLQGMIV